MRSFVRGVQSPFEIRIQAAGKLPGSACPDSLTFRHGLSFTPLNRPSTQTGTPCISSEPDPTHTGRVLLDVHIRDVYITWRKKPVRRRPLCTSHTHHRVCITSGYPTITGICSLETVSRSRWRVPLSNALNKLSVTTFCTHPSPCSVERHAFVVVLLSVRSCSGQYACTFLASISF